MPSFERTPRPTWASCLKPLFFRPYIKENGLRRPMLHVGQLRYVLVDRPLSRYCRDKALAAGPVSARPAFV